MSASTTIRRPVPPPPAVIASLAAIATRLETLAARRFGAAMEAMVCAACETTAARRLDR